MDLGFSTVDALNKGASLYSHAAIVRRSTDFAHCRALDHVVGESTAVGDAVSAKSYYNYKTHFEVLRENQQFERQDIARS